VTWRRSNKEDVIIIPKKIFREYDIRGVVGDDLTDEGVYRLGLAIAASMVRENIRQAVVGRDNRLSSESFSQSLSDGMMKGGVDVVDIGVVPTPVLYFAAKRWNMSGGVMITASHNPPEFNGFKVIRGEGTIYGKAIGELWDIAAGDLDESGSGRLDRRDANHEYVDYLSEHIKLERPVAFAADGGNGTSGIVAEDLFRGLGCSPVYLYMEPDGNYPNHHPDPTRADNLQDLRKSVLENRLELGVGFDGDSDRLGVIDDNGEILWGDRLLALFAREVLQDHPGASVIFEVKCSQSLAEDITKHGGRPIMWKTGHSLIKKKMREEGALLAGEMSGHLFFADRYFGFDDAIYATCRLLEIVSKGRRSLNELLSDLPKYESTPEIRIDCPDEEKFRIVGEVRDYFKRDHEVIDVDGARIQFEDGWGLIRASNTQPVLVLRFEAKTKESLRRIEIAVADILGRYIDVEPSEWE
jgi:phosphomannomutase/phosphoglucomutase